MIQFKGLVEKEIGGKKITFKFNMAALTLFGDLQNASLSDLAKELMNPKLSTVANFLYAGAVTYCKQEKVKQEFTQDDASEWMGELGFKEALQILNEAFEVPEIKNSQPPKEGAKIEALETSLSSQ